MEKIKLGQTPDCLKVLFDGNMFKIKGKVTQKIPLSKADTAKVDVLDDDMGSLKLIGKNRTLVQMELPLRYCEVGQGWFLDKLSRRKR